MYTVVGGVKSRTMRVLWMLEELGQPYEHQPEPPRSEAVRKLNPLGKVPVLIDGDAVLTDSVAILTYLADKHGAMTFPAGTIDRARQDAITNFVLDEMDALLWAAARHSFILPEERRVPEVKETLRWEFQRTEKRLAAFLGDGPFLMGETITIPDIIAVHCWGWAISARFPQDEPAVRAYAERLRERPAFRRAADR